MEWDEIVEEHQDDICDHCEKYIIDGSWNSSNGWLCEGRWCVEASESYFEEYPQKLRKYKILKINKT